MDHNQFAEIGDSFSQSQSAGLLASIKKQSKAFFIREHTRKLEVSLPLRVVWVWCSHVGRCQDLPTILEAEGWVRMPVNPHFSAMGA